MPQNNIRPFVATIALAGLLLVGAMPMAASAQTTTVTTAPTTAPTALATDVPSTSTTAPAPDQDRHDFPWGLLGLLGLAGLAGLRRRGDTVIRTTPPR